MDTMRQFEDEQRPGFAAFDAGSAADTDPVPPPAIGQDERRMHVRAYNYWANLLGERSFPAIDDLDLTELGDFGSNAVLLDFTSGIENPAIGYVGDSLLAECQLDPDVAYIADVPRKSLLSRLTDHYLQIIANRAPIGFEAEFVNGRGATILYRGVLLPFSSDDDTIDFILGVINWKEAADPDLNDALAREVAAAAALQPAVPGRAAVMPLWADGPASDALAAANDGDAMAADELPADDMNDADHAAVDHADAAGDELVLADALALDAGDATLADHLAAAREVAGLALQNEARGHKALYDAIGKAWAFARAVDGAPADFAELAQEAQIKVNPRAPLTAVAKLVFGASYDKTRLAEITTLLGYAAREALEPAELTQRIASHPGGIKALVRAERALRRSDRPKADPLGEAKERLRAALPIAEVVGLADDAEFAVLIVRRTGDGQHAVVARLADSQGDAVIARFARAAA